MDIQKIMYLQKGALDSKLCNIMSDFSRQVSETYLNVNDKYKNKFEVLGNMQCDIDAEELRLLEEHASSVLQEDIELESMKCEVPEQAMNVTCCDPYLVLNLLLQEGSNVAILPTNDAHFYSDAVSYYKSVLDGILHCEFNYIFSDICSSFSSDEESNISMISSALWKFMNSELYIRRLNSRQFTNASYFVNDERRLRDTTNIVFGSLLRCYISSINVDSNEVFWRCNGSISCTSLLGKLSSMVGWTFNPCKNNSLEVVIPLTYVMKMIADEQYYMLFDHQLQTVFMFVPIYREIIYKESLYNVVAVKLGQGHMLNSKYDISYDDMLDNDKLCKALNGRLCSRVIDFYPHERVVVPDYFIRSQLYFNKREESYSGQFNRYQCELGINIFSFICLRIVNRVRDGSLDLSMFVHKGRSIKVHGVIATRTELRDILVRYFKYKQYKDNSQSYLAPVALEDEVPSKVRRKDTKMKNKSALQKVQAEIFV